MKKKYPSPNLLTQARQCVTCGLCDAVCPVFSATRKESHSPRGKIAILRAWLAGMVSSGEVCAILSFCNNCGRCEKACPAHLPLRAIFQAGLREMRPGCTLSGTVAMTLLRFPRFFDLAQPPLAIMQRLRKSHNNGASLPLAPLPCRSVRKAAEEMDKKPVALLFGGCMAKRVYPHLLRTAMDVLRKQGYKVLMPNLPCCGRPDAVDGHWRQAETTANRIAAILSRHEFDCLLTLCPACLEQITERWPAYESGHREYLADLARRSMDISAILPVPPARNDSDSFTALWHRPCLMNDPTAGKIQAILPAYCQTRAMTDGCCGGHPSTGDWYPFANVATDQAGMDTHSAVVENISRKRRDEIMGERVPMVVTACPGCKHRLEKAMAQNDDKVMVRHWLEIYARDPEE